MQQALYRKYRPEKLSQLVGQEEAVSLITQQIKKDNLGHAYLFSGPRGVGKTSLARIIATQLGCDPIFDITEIDAASNNKVDDIRDMNESVNFIASSPGQKRVYILDEVHMLSNAASNAFLKTLEEPPEHIIFILATTEPERVLETVKSRTTHIVFKKISEEDIVKTIQEIGKKEKMILELDVLKIIATFSDGSLRDGINLFEQTYNTFGKKTTVDDLYGILGKLSTKEFETIINSIETQDTAAVLRVIRDAYKKGLQPSDVMESISEFFRNMFYLKYLPNDEKLDNLTPNIKTLLETADKKVNAKQLIRILDLIDDLNQNLSNSTSQHLKLELFLMKVIKPELGSDVKTIGYRIDLLEGKLSNNEVMPKKMNSPQVEKKDTPSEISIPKNISKKNSTPKKESLGNFDVFWPKILEEMKQALTPRKYSYLTAVRAEVEEEDVINLIVDKENEFLFEELKKSEEIIDLLKSIIAKMMGLEIIVKVTLSLDTKKNNHEKGLSVAQEIFDVEDLT
ncbi:DNA polymerase III subunit gamma/tau [Acidimicrobiia bacterium]|nr:DNA polymerase III subunit gamma/tau [Acidimicrobiia bacterium]